MKKTILCLVAFLASSSMVSALSSKKSPFQLSGFVGMQKSEINIPYNGIDGFTSVAQGISAATISETPSTVLADLGITLVDVATPLSANLPIVSSNFNYAAAKVGTSIAGLSTGGSFTGKFYIPCSSFFVGASGSIYYSGSKHLINVNIEDTGMTLIPAVDVDSNNILDYNSLNTVQTDTVQLKVINGMTFNIEMLAGLYITDSTSIAGHVGFTAMRSSMRYQTANFIERTPADPDNPRTSDDVDLSSGFISATGEDSVGDLISYSPATTKKVWHSGINFGATMQVQLTDQVAAYVRSEVVIFNKRPYNIENVATYSYAATQEAQGTETGTISLQNTVYQTVLGLSFTFGA